VVQFSYDARNRCVARTVNGNITRFVYDGWSLLEELNASGTEQARYYHGAMIDELLLCITANTYYYHHDGLGSTVALTDSTGALAESYTYDVFGSPTILVTNSQALAVSAVGNRFLFTGREFLAEIGLYDYRNRFYSPSLGRFLQTDPIGFEARSVNLYMAVLNNSLNFIDPFGLKEFTVNACEIVIAYGHSSKYTPHTFKFNSPCARAASIGCWPIWTNGRIPEQQRIPGAPDHNDIIWWLPGDLNDLSNQDKAALELSKKADAYHEGMDELARVQMSARREAAKLCQDKCCKDKTVTIRYERTTVSTFQNWTTIPHLSNETLDCKSGSWQ
jgi:RHS repeat-associated protein